MTVSIHGREYRTVAERIGEFRSLHPDWTIRTNMIRVDDSRVIFMAEILDPDRRTISTGYAEEKWESSKINRTSAVENCETSAVGRALAFFGLAGNEIASADEVAGAISQQTHLEPAEQARRAAAAVRITPKPEGTSKPTNKMRFLASVAKWTGGERGDSNTITACTSVLRLHDEPTDGTCKATRFRELSGWVDEQIENKVSFTDLFPAEETVVESAT